MGEDDEGMMSATGKELKKSESKGLEANLPRYKTRLFAAEYVSHHCETDPMFIYACQWSLELASVFYRFFTV
jgi:hypothetical protein